MIRLWGMTIKKHRRTAEFIVQLPGVWGPRAMHDGLQAICEKLDVPRPVVLSKHEREMRQFGRTRFTQDDFIDTIPFDSFEIEILRERKKGQPQA